mgnify:CR=1 FL=1
MMCAGFLVFSGLPSLENERSPHGSWQPRPVSVHGSQKKRLYDQSDFRIIEREYSHILKGRIKNAVSYFPDISCNRVSDPVFEFLLLAGIPPGDVLQVSCHPADLDDVMGTALGADGLAAQGAVLDPGDHLVRAVAVIERAHDLKLGLPTIRARDLVHDEVAGMALVFALYFRNIVEFLVFFCNFPLICAPVHTTTLQKCLINF